MKFFRFMGRFSKKSIFSIFATWIVVFFLHNTQYLLAYFMELEDETIFTPFSYKAPFGLAEDNLAYAKMVRYSSDNPTLFTHDGVIKENKGLKFPVGNIILIYLGMVNNLLGDINLTYYLGGLFPLLISIILVFKTVQLFFSKHAIPISIGISIIILCSNFNDFLGLEKFIKAFLIPENYRYNGNVLVFGYAQRFAFSQSTIFLFLFWFYQLVKYLKESSIKNQVLLVLAITLLQYSYFYFWSYAIPFSIAIIAVSNKKLKDYVILLVSTLILTLPFWLEVLDFNQTDFYTEYQEKMSGAQTYDSILVIVFVGTLNLVPFLKEGNKWFNILLILTPVFLTFIIDYLNYTFQSYHAVFYLTKLTILPVFITLGLLAKFWNKWHKEAMLCLINYYLIILLCNLKFIIGFNLQPYHWVYTAYYPVLIFTLLIAWNSRLSSEVFKQIALTFSVIIIILGVFNSFKTADHNHDFWTISKDDQETINFLQKHPYTVIAGNNMMPIITFSAHTDLYIYEGMTCNSRSSLNESSQRFIYPYKLMGYSDTSIIGEFNKYKELPTYNQVFTKGSTIERDSLSHIFPDNILGSIESMFHYFTSPKKYEKQFIKSLKEFSTPDFELDFIVIYKLTFRGEYTKISAKKVFENDTYIIYQNRSQIKADLFPIPKLNSSLIFREF